MFDTLLFVCAICEREVRDYPNRRGPDRSLDPVCRYCEKYWTERVGKPAFGSFMDRRRAMQVSALSEALHTKARHKQWSSSHGFS
jgi:hypothetical protein